MEPYVGQIMYAAFNFEPQGWIFCDGRLLPIAENATLFNLIGTTFGGDGQTTFGIPDLRGRLPVHVGGNYAFGQLGGVEQVTLNLQQYPTHNHGFLCSNAASTANSPAASVPGSGQNIYRANPALSETMSAKMCAPQAGAANQPHTNIQPYLVANWIISLYGVYPSQS